MKSFFTTIILLSIFAVEGNCQNKYPVPKGHSIYKDYDGKAVNLQSDFDGDGINDLAIVYAKNNSEYDNIFAVYLSTKQNNRNLYYYFPFSSISYNLEIKNNVLSIGACFGTGRYCKTLKFKFYPALKNMRLIGYDEESFGNALHEGAYVKSVNLLTNKYEISGPKWKNKIVKTSRFTLITLENISEKKLEYLENIGAAYLK